MRSRRLTASSRIGGACSLKRREPGLVPAAGTNRRLPSKCSDVASGSIRVYDMLVRRSRRRVKVAVWIFG